MLPLYTTPRPPWHSFKEVTGMDSSVMFFGPLSAACLCLLWRFIDGPTGLWSLPAPSLPVVFVSPSVTWLRVRHGRHGERLEE